MTGVLLFAFIAGVITTANPCAFALLPAYLAHRIRPHENDGHNQPTIGLLKAMTVGLATTSGFIAVFIIVGIGLAAGGNWLMTVQPWAGVVTGIIMAGFGLAVLLGHHIRIPLPNIKPAQNSDSIKGDFIFGVGYGIASISCTLPIFLSVTGTAVTGSYFASTLTFTAYAIGMGTVLMSLSIMAAYARSGLARNMRKLAPFVNTTSGIILILSGTYLSYFFGASLFDVDIPEGFDLIGSGQMLSGTLQTMMSGATGTIVFLTLSGTIGLLFIYAIIKKHWMKTDL